MQIFDLHMSKLPVVSGREVVKALQKVGFMVVGRKGSHIRLKRFSGKDVL